MPLTPARDFGVQSYCFRNFKDNKEVAQLVKKIGVDKIELCGIHANFNNPTAFKDVVKIYNDAGVKVVSIGVQTFKGNAEERQWFECAAIAGAKHISTHFTIDTFTKAVPATAKLGDEFDINLGIHCHGGYMFGGSPVELKHLLSLGGNRIGICIDTAWCMQIGPRDGNPVKWVTDTFKGRIFGIHYKDFTFSKNAQWTDTIVGTGNLDLPAFIKALEANAFTGMAVIEYEADADNPTPALTECVKKMRSA